MNDAANTALGLSPGQAEDAPPRRLPLTPAQRIIVKDQRGFPDSPLYNVGGSALIDGDIDLGYFRTALQRLTDESDALRLVIAGDGTQHLLPRFMPVILRHDVSDAPDPDAAAHAYIRADFAKPLPLDGVTPPWYVALVKAGKARYWLHLHFHHAIMDGYGSAVVMQRWAEHYNALSEGRAALPVDPGTWQRHVGETRDYEASDACRKDAAFWQDQLPEVPPALFDIGPREPRTVDAETTRVARARYATWENAGRAQKGSAFHVVLAAVALYYACTLGRKRLAIGVPVLNRSGRAQRAAAGMFAQVVPLIVEVRDGATTADLIAEIARTLRHASRHQRYPLDTLYKRLDLARQRRISAFDIVLSFMRQNYELSFGASPMRHSRQHFTGISRFPVGLTVCEFDATEDIAFVAEFYPGIAGRSGAARISQRLLEIADALSGAERPLSEIPLMTAQEWQTTVAAQYAPARHPAIDHTVLDQVLQAVRDRPQAVAIRQQQGEVTYADLQARACAIATALGSQPAVDTPRIIGLACDRSPDFIAAVLGCMMARAAFLPLDIDQPDGRLATVLEMTRPALILAEAAQASRLRRMAPTLSLEEIGRAAPGIAAPPGPEDIAYVLTTSGSTGTPKAVMVSHRALAARIAEIARKWTIGPEDTTYQSLRLTFDPALADLFLPLTTGGTVALSPPGRLSPTRMLDDIARLGVTVLISTPTLLDRLVDELERRRLSLSLKLCTSGGEVLTQQLMRRLVDRLGPNVQNAYGPTEATIFATTWQTVPDGVAPIPVGRPLRHTTVMVMAEGKTPLPPFETGEICIGGRTLASGYLGDPVRTRQKFRPDPLAPRYRGDADASLYRTGDLGWMDDSGVLHFAGRSDRQIKLRGYLIEPEDIEAAIAACPEVASAAVKLVTGTDDARLHAFVAPQEGRTIDPEALSAELRAALPDYMWPSGFTFLETMPRTAVGKIDFAALTPAQQSPRPARDAQAVPATTQLEQEVRRIWSDVLKCPVGVEDDFFALGGDSFGAVEMLSAVSTSLGREVPFATLLSNPGFRPFTGALARTIGATPVQTILSQGSGAVSVHIAASGYGDAMRFLALADALPEMTVSMLQPPDAPAGAPSPGIADLAELYADAVQATRADTVILAGFSIGGIVALEAARLLAQRGTPANRLALIDTLHPGGQRVMLRLWQGFKLSVSLLGLKRLSLNSRQLSAMTADPALDLQIRAASLHRIAPFPGPLDMLFSSGGRPFERAFRPLWRGCLTTPATVHRLPGFHGSMFRPPHLDSLASAFRTLASGKVGESDMPARSWR
ncbi:non-ribosomal peptide synthetase [Pseudodonghicola flavimaris]|uniref:Amino acid adenylation domain-containing protein n=1 Tax=Pseudodonghicola flavimaris TaxID=3050036 RepID=A0ABT7F1T3_9RHOB|nr:amino acid adenylation domain-containing protein [Pseudodonghicola flavimaris]MDK3018566.1 amino acid adenylation domain-containing protein [Pseudodonghicola flavimaris]